MVSHRNYYFKAVCKKVRSDQVKRSFIYTKKANIRYLFTKYSIKEFMQTRLAFACSGLLYFNPSWNKLLICRERLASKW